MPRSAVSTRLITRDMSKSGSFDGTSTYCTVPITPSTTAFSVAFWVKVGNGNANNARILDWQDGGPLNGFTFNLGALSGSRLSFSPVFGDGTGNIGAFNVYTAVPGDWSHHVLTYTANDMKWYVNGTLFGTDTSGTMTAASTTLTIGRRAPSAANFFKGLIDGFVFLNGRAMTATEVTTLYTAGIHPSDTSCHIRFNDNVTDETANANNLTAFNLTYSTDVALKTRSTFTIPAVRKSVSGNLLFNGNFEYLPASNTPMTSVGDRFITGTATGSTTDNTYQWYVYNYAGTRSAQFDTTTSYSGSGSLKLTTNAGSIGVSLHASTANHSSWSINNLPAEPNTSYTISCWIKTNYISGDATTGAQVTLSERTSNNSSAGGGRTVVTGLKTSQDWTYYTSNLTTGTTTRFIHPNFAIVGNNGTATLNMEAWFDDIRLTKTTPDTRSAA